MANANDSLRLFAARGLLKRLQTLIGETEGVRQAEDIEFIHRMRVATRRLRAALAALEPALQPKLARRWRKHVRRLTRALGPARDLDVQIEFVRTFQASLSEPRSALPGVERLLLRLTQERAAVQPKVLKALDRAERPKGLHAMMEELCEMLAKAEASPAAENDRGEADGLEEHSRRAILETLEELLFHAPCVREPQQVEQHHEMRIAAKRLRYAMEVFQPLFGEPMETRIEQVKKLQTVLGDLHDCDVWIETLPLFIEEERERMIEFQGHLRGFRRLRSGLEDLLESRRIERGRLYEKFVSLWQKLEEEGLWGRIREMVRPGTDAEPLMNPP